MICLSESAFCCDHNSEQSSHPRFNIRPDQMLTILLFTFTIEDQKDNLETCWLVFVRRGNMPSSPEPAISEMSISSF